MKIMAVEMVLEGLMCVLKAMVRDFLGIWCLVSLENL